MQEIETKKNKSSILQSIINLSFLNGKFFSTLSTGFAKEQCKEMNSTRNTLKSIDLVLDYLSLNSIKMLR